MGRITKKFHTLLHLDWNWAIRFYKKRFSHRWHYNKSIILRRKYWNVRVSDLNLKFGFFAPYHHSVALGYSMGGYEPALLKWREEAPKHKLIYDIGGYAGLYGLVAAKANPSARVVIFEPDPINAKHCELNIALNELRNCSVNRSAVGETVGTIRFEANGTTGARIGKGNEVPITKIDAEESPDLMKVDVEGAESAVFRGARETLKRHPVIFLEVHEWLQDKDAMWNQLRDEGYSSVMADGDHYLLRA